MAEDYSSSYSMDAVREAFCARENAYRQNSAATPSPYPYRYVKEVWTDFVLVCDETGSRYSGLVKVPYTVDSNGQITFGEDIPVRAEYVAMSGSPLWVNPHGPAVLRLSARLEKNL